MERKGKSKTWRRVLKEVSAILLWVFLFVKFFVFDIDVYLVSAVGDEWMFLLKYKFFVILALGLLLWHCLGTRGFLSWLFFVLVSPFLFILWRIPQVLLRSKSWVVVVGYFSAIISFFKSLKANLVLFGIISLSTVLILTQKNEQVLVACMLALGASLVWHYIKRFIDSFKPPELFGANAGTLKKIGEGLQMQYINNRLLTEKKKNDMSEEEYKKYVGKLEQVVLFDRLWYFLASKLRDFRKSRTLMIFCFGKLIYTLVITIIFFAILNYAVYKINPGSFVTPSTSVGFIHFIYYSFNAIFTSNLIDFYPVGSLARLMNCMEIFFGFMIVVIIFFIITTVHKEKHTEELDRMIGLARTQGRELDALIHTEFDLTVEEAITEIEKIKGSTLKLIYYLASRIEKS